MPDGAWVFLAALAVRLVYVFIAARGDPFFDYTLKGFDQHVYREQALAILNGDWLLRAAGLFYFSPLFSYAGALVYRVVGANNFLGFHVAQALLGAATCALCWALARTWLGRWGALAAGALWALAAPWLFYEQALLHEGLMLFLYAVTLWGCRQAQLWSLRQETCHSSSSPQSAIRNPQFFLLPLCTAGLACALAAIGRGTALALLVVLPVWLVVALRAPAGPAIPNAPRLRRLRRGGLGTLCFLAGAALALGMLAWRNHAVAGRWTLGMENGKVLFYLGNAADAEVGFTYTPRFEAAQAQAAHDPAAYLRAFREDLRRAPGHIAYNLLRKSWLFFAARDLPDNLNFHLGRRLIAPLRWTPVAWAWLVPLGLLGLGLSLCEPARGGPNGRGRRWSLLWLFTLIFAATLILIMPIGRYRLPALIPLGIWAGGAIEWLGGELRQRRWTHIYLATGAFATLALALWPWRLGPAIREADYLAASQAALEMNRHPLTRRVLELGQRDYPGSVPLLQRALELAAAEGDHHAVSLIAEWLWEMHAWTGPSGLLMADHFTEAGQPGRARAVLEKILTLDPANTAARRKLEGLGK